MAGQGSRLRGQGPSVTCGRCGGQPAHRLLSANGHRPLRISRPVRQGRTVRHWNSQHPGRPFPHRFSDGEEWLVEFPDSQVDGEVVRIALDPGIELSVISPESLIVDRVLQATDGTCVTRDEAERL